MANKYRVGAVDYPQDDDPTFSDFYQALKYTEDEGIKYMDTMYAIWENDHPIVILYMFDIFTKNGWLWPLQPRQKQMALELL
ncbi:MAG: hypothetical protein JRI53_04505 [Deltaproteobacteria bacterium]|nr:hypothetical protein [Deltaproteobacteria bacterium]